MNYVIVTIEWCLSKGIVVPSHARKSLNGEKVIFHQEYLKPVLSVDDGITVHRYGDPALDEILSGPEWMTPEPEMQEEAV